jgi:hypothetical protein
MVFSSSLMPKKPEQKGDLDAFNYYLGIETPFVPFGMEKWRSVQKEARSFRLFSFVRLRA